MGNCLRSQGPEEVEALLRKLYSKYASHLLPLERSSMFTELGDPPYSLEDVLAPPMILMIGQFSTGKTTFIKALLGKDYPMMKIAAAAATDNFTAIVRGSPEDEVLGATVVKNMSLPFHALGQKFDDDFLQRFRGAYVSEGDRDGILDDLILVDTPGTLGGGDRRYNYPEAMAWFARRAAMIIIFFDVNKTNVDVEMKRVLESIQGNEEKVTIVFNKADTVDAEDLANAKAGLMFNLAKSLPTPEVPRVFMTSLKTLKDDYDTKAAPAFIEEFSKDKKELLENIKRVRENTYHRKINLMDKRSRMVRNHAYFMMKLLEERKRYVGFFRRKLRAQDKDRLIQSVPELYRMVQQDQNRAPGEFLTAGSLQSNLSHLDLDRLPVLSRSKVEKAFRGMERALTQFPQQPARPARTQPHL